MARSLLRSLAEFVITKVFDASKAHVLPRMQQVFPGAAKRKKKRLTPEKRGRIQEFLAMLRKAKVR